MTLLDEYMREWGYEFPIANASRRPRPVSSSKIDKEEVESVPEIAPATPARRRGRSATPRTQKAAKPAEVPAATTPTREQVKSQVRALVAPAPMPRAPIPPHLVAALQRVGAIPTARKLELKPAVVPKTPNPEPPPPPKTPAPAPKPKSPAPKPVRERSVAARADTPQVTGDMVIGSHEGNPVYRGKNGGTYYIDGQGPPSLPQDLASCASR
jgi:hypothetical protein